MSGLDNLKAEVKAQAKKIGRQTLVLLLIVLVTLLKKLVKLYHRL